MAERPSQRRVVITGLGVVSPLGISASSMLDSLSAGASGVDFLQLLPSIDGRIVYGGEATDFTGHIDNFGDLPKDRKKAIRKALKMMCRETMMAVAAAQQAIADARCDAAAVDPERSGVVFGSDYMLSPPEDFIGGMNACGVGSGAFRFDQWGDIGLGEMNPLWMLKYLPNMPASHIGIFNDFRGPNNSLTLREAAGSIAIREAAQTISRGHADRMLAGATGTRIHPFKTVHAVQTQQLADPELPPAEASRPFDRHRTGMVAGEGAGALMLEELDAAISRNADIYGEVIGTGSSAVVGDEVRGRRREALVNAIEAALRDARCAPENVGHVVAHGLADRASDIDEARALATVFGDPAGPGEADAAPPVFAGKSYFGNLGAASGVVELIASLAALQEGRMHGTLNCANPDPECPVRIAEAGEPAGDRSLQISVTPQGQSAAVLVARHES